MSASRLQRRAVAPAPESRGRSSVPKRTNSSPTFTCLSLDDSLSVSPPSASGASPPSSPEDEVEQGYAMDLSRRPPASGREGDRDENADGDREGGREGGQEDAGSGERSGRRPSGGSDFGLGLDVDPHAVHAAPSIASVLGSPPPSFGRLSLGAPGMRLPGERDRDRVARMGATGNGVGRARCRRRKEELTIDGDIPPETKESEDRAGAEGALPAGDEQYAAWRLLARRLEVRLPSSH